MGARCSFTFKRSQLRWCGCLIRKPPGGRPRFVSFLVTSDWYCRRPPGGCRTRWRDCISYLILYIISSGECGNAGCTPLLSFGQKFLTTVSKKKILLNFADQNSEHLVSQTDPQHPSLDEWMVSCRGVLLSVVMSSGTTLNKYYSNISDRSPQTPESSPKTLEPTQSCTRAVKMSHDELQ